MRIAETMVFHCSRERLWAYIKEPDKQKQWMKGLLANDSTSPGQEGVGSTFRMRIKEGAKVTDFNGEVTAFDPPSRLEVVMSGGHFPKGSAMRVEYRLTDVGGATRLDYSAAFEGKPLGFFLRLLMPLFKLFGRMQLRSFLRSLRTLVEEPAAAA